MVPSLDVFYCIETNSMAKLAEKLNEALARGHKPYGSPLVVELTEHKWVYSILVMKSPS